MSRFTDKNSLQPPLDAAWFAEYMDELPEVELRDEIVSFTTVTIFVSIAAAVVVPFAVAPFLNYVSLLVLALGLGVLSLLTFIDNERLPTNAAVAAKVVIIAAFTIQNAHGKAPLFCLLIVVLVVAIGQFATSVVKEFISWQLRALNCPDAEKTFYTETFLSRDLPLSRRKLRWLISLVGNSDNAHVRQNAMERVYPSLQKLHAANSPTPGGFEMVCFCIYAIGLTATDFFAVSYFVPQFFVYYIALSYFIFRLSQFDDTQTSELHEEEHIHIELDTHDIELDTRDAAIRKWFAADSGRLIGYLCVVALTTVLFARSSYYFPLASLGTEYAAQKYLRHYELDDTTQAAKTFLAAKPENWLLVNCHAARAGEYHRLLAFIPSLALCYYVPKVIADMVAAKLIEPMVFGYRLLISYAEEMRRYGVLRDLDEDDMVEPYITEPYSKG